MAKARKQDDQINLAYLMNEETKEIFEKLQTLYKEKLNIELTNTQLVEVCIKQWYKAYTKQRNQQTKPSDTIITQEMLRKYNLVTDEEFREYIDNTTIADLGEVIKYPQYQKIKMAYLYSEIQEGLSEPLPQNKCESLIDLIVDLWTEDKTNGLDIFDMCYEIIDALRDKKVDIDDVLHCENYNILFDCIYQREPWTTMPQYTEERK